MLKDKLYNFFKGENGQKIIPPILVILGILVVSAVVWIALPTREHPQEEQEQIAVEKNTENEIRHPLTGEIIEEEIHPELYAVIVENSLDAWPQSGVEDAFLVIEAPVEGNITRWLTFYSGDTETKKIGPVRSARPYFVELALGFDSLLAHVGGSPEGLALIKSTNTYDVDEFFYGRYFWRAKDRYAPHNAYTETDRLKKVWDDKVKSPQKYQEILFKSEPEGRDTELEIDDIKINFHNTAYNVTWKYDAKTNTYKRNQVGVKHKMASKQQLYANNLIEVKTDISVIDNVGRKRIRTIGEGDAVIYQNGEEIEVTWKKEKAANMMRFYDDQNQEITLLPGKTWIEITSEQ